LWGKNKARFKDKQTSPNPLFSPPSGGEKYSPTVGCIWRIFIIRLVQCPNILERRVDMTLIDFLILAVVAAICGMIGESLAGYSVGGCLVSAVIGYIGAFVGLWVARQFGLPELFTITIGGTSIPVIWSIIGSALLVAGLALVRRVTA
jgi:uncharacterized membrane protein YeaQ/YmgE (transglycosylase-associated protein family)